MAAPEQRAGNRSGFKWGAGGTLVVALAAGAYWFAARTEAPDLNDPVLIAAGRTAYAAYCAECHGGNLEGEPNWRTPNADGSLTAPPHDASGHTWHHPDRVLFEIMLEGGAAAAPPGFPSRMPAYAGTLAEREIWAVLAFIKSTWPDDIRARQSRLGK
ncbi:MAG: cytochrome c [Pseudomonadota bacterium]